MKKTSFRTIILAAAAALIALFFLPVYNILGLQMIAGSDGISSLKQMLGVEMEVMGIKTTIIPGQILVGLKLLLPAAVLLVWLVLKPKKKELISLILGAADFIFCLVSFSMLKSSLYGYEPSRSIFYFLELLLAFAIAAFSFLLMKGGSVDVAAAGTMLGKAAGNVAKSGRQLAQSFNEGAAAANEAAAGSARTCRYCGEQVPEGVDFCGKCGTKYIPMTYHSCPNCGSLLEDDDLFCPVCGAKSGKTEDRICVKCGRIFSGDNAFCPYCGKKYVDPEKRTCPSCGAELPVGADFCGRCGARYK